MDIEDKIIDKLYALRYIGPICLNPRITELLVPWECALQELRLIDKNITLKQLQTILKKNNISRLSPEEFLKLRKTG